MFKDREKLYQVYHTLLTIALTWALVLVINKYFNLGVPIIISAIYSFTPAILIYLFDINRKSIISYLLLGSIIPILALIFWITRTNLIHWLGDLIDWCMTFNGEEELYVWQHAHTVIVGVALIGAIVFYLLTGRQLLKIILAVILFTAMVILSINEVQINKAVVGISIFYIMTIIVEVYGMIYSRKSGKLDKKEGILYMAPICLLLAVLAIALPSKPEPLQWKAVKNVYNNVKEQIEIWRTDLNYYLGNAKSEFFVSLTGYSENNGELQSDSKLIKDNKIAMKLSGLDKGHSAYLIGSVSDIYTGTSWEKSRLDYLADQEDYYLDYLEMFFALSRQDLEVLQNNRFLEDRSLRVEYNNIKTKTFFYPLKMSTYTIYSKHKKLTTLTPQINYVKASGKGTLYKTDFYEMNLQGEAFIKMLREADAFTYDNEYSIKNDSATFINDSILARDEAVVNFGSGEYKLLRERAKMIETSYTNLPDTLPDRVYELAEGITADCDTEYDKLKAIETYLAENYTYSLDAQIVPKGQDFMDYFLFGSKKGYCTSFASAFAVLGRCIGVPTRYVEGFLGNFKVSDENNMYLIKSSQAHAWAEAYIEGVGWIPFEATAPFYTNRYTKWAELPKKGTGDTSSSFVPLPDYPKEESQPYQPEEEIVVIKNDNTKEIISGLLIFLSIVAILLLVMITYYYILQYRYKKIYDRADNSKKMYMQFLRILRLLKREGYVLNQQETILMLSDRIKARFHYDRVTFPDVANIFMRYRYAEEEVTEEELKMVIIYHQGLENKEREEVSRLKVWLKEFIFLARKGGY